MCIRDRNECQQKGFMVLGMDDIGDYSQYASKESLRQELIEVYDNSTSRKNQVLFPTQGKHLKKFNRISNGLPKLNIWQLMQIR